MIAWFTRNHVAANLLMVGIFFSGLYVLFTQIPLEVFPSFEIDRVDVKVNCEAQRQKMLSRVLVFV